MLRHFMDKAGGLCDSAENPVRGVRACNCEFVQRGWRGELFFGDKEHRTRLVRRSGANLLTAKSSTMKGPIENVRKGLPVRV